MKMEKLQEAGMREAAVNNVIKGLFVKLWQNQNENTEKSSYKQKNESRSEKEKIDFLQKALFSLHLREKKFKKQAKAESNQLLIENSILLKQLNNNPYKINV